jgi:hypothetical protein
MSDATGVAEGMLGLDGFRVLGLQETASEVVILVEAVIELMGAPCVGSSPEPTAAEPPITATWPPGLKVAR